MDISFAYHRSRKTLGQPLRLERFAPETIAEIPPDKRVANAYVVPDTKETEISNVPTLSEHSTNTEHVSTMGRGMEHIEGGWPRDVDHQEPEQTVRYCRKAAKEATFIPAVAKLVARLRPSIRQNNAVDIYPPYWEPSPHIIVQPTSSSGEKKDESDDDEPQSPIGASASMAFSDSRRGSTTAGQPLNSATMGATASIAGAVGPQSPTTADPTVEAEGEDEEGEDGDDAWQGTGFLTVATLRDPLADAENIPGKDQQGRAAVSTSWNLAEGSRTKVAVAFAQTSVGHSSNVTQLVARRESTASYVFDINSPHHPEMILDAFAPLSVISYGTRDVNLIAGGCTDGTVVLFDTRRGSTPVTVAGGGSNGGTVTALCWMQVTTKSMELFSAYGTSDCAVWDMRKPLKPVDQIKVAVRGSSRPHCAMCADYCPSSVGPGKVLVGTDSGCVVVMSRRGRTESDRVSMVHGAHHGPITTVIRHPTVPKVFLTTGDWSVALWHEELRGPLLNVTTRPSCVMDACWHSSHPSILFTLLEDGTLEAWDLLRSHEKPQCSVRVSSIGARSVQCNFDGCHVTVGCLGGAAVVVQPHPALLANARHPSVAKQSLQQLVEREFARQRQVVDVWREGAGTAGASPGHNHSGGGSQRHSTGLWPSASGTRDGSLDDDGETVVRVARPISSTATDTDALDELLGDVTDAVDITAKTATARKERLAAQLADRKRSEVEAERFSRLRVVGPDITPPPNKARPPSSGDRDAPFALYGGPPPPSNLYRSADTSPRAADGLDEDQRSVTATFTDNAAEEDEEMLSVSADDRDLLLDLIGTETRAADLDDEDQWVSVKGTNIHDPRAPTPLRAATPATPPPARRASDTAVNTPTPPKEHRARPQSAVARRHQ